MAFPMTWSLHHFEILASELYRVGGVYTLLLGLVARIALADLNCEDLGRLTVWANRISEGVLDRVVSVPPNQRLASKVRKS